MSAGEVLEEVEERTDWALMEAGMDSYDLDLTPAQRKVISDAITIETGMTDGEMGEQQETSGGGRSFCVSIKKFR